jgi:microcystin-dependent protein
MTIFTETWDAAFEQSPADTDNASQGAGKIRGSRIAVQERFEVDHSHAGDASDGEHKKLTLPAQGSDPANVTARYIGYITQESERPAFKIRNPSGTIFDLMPAGVMLPYGGSAAPNGWLLCDGTSYVRTDYPRLFTAIGTAFGAADGSHFNVPAQARRTLVGAGGGGTATLANTVGSVGGEEAHLLTSGESGLPAHLHVIQTQQGGGAFGKVSEWNTTGGSASTKNTDNVAAANASTAHNNMQPSLVVNFIIKT